MAMNLQFQKKTTKKITQPLYAFYTLFKEKTRVEVWLVEQTDIRIQGRVSGFDEYINMVLEGAVEYDTRTKTTKDIGRILLKGENIVLVRTLEEMRQ